ncbi:hypothetical protein Tco_0456308, partial [Tanacetum coccineum]
PILLSTTDIELTIELLYVVLSSRKYYNAVGYEDDLEELLQRFREGEKETDECLSWWGYQAVNFMAVPYAVYMPNRPPAEPSVLPNLRNNRIMMNSRQTLLESFSKQHKALLQLITVKLHHSRLRKDFFRKLLYEGPGAVGFNLPKQTSEVGVSHWPCA